MSLLTRAKQLIFGNSAGTGEFGVIGSKSAGSAATSKDIETIQGNSNYLLGLFSITSDQGTSRLPYTEDINSLFYLLSSQLAYLFQNGIPEWLDDADTFYYANVSFVVGSDGNIYQAVLGDDVTNLNTGNDPVGDDGTWWKCIIGISNTTVSLDGTESPLLKENHYTIDTSLGDVTLTLDDGLFNGQKVHIICDGSGLGALKGSGIYNGASSTGIFISDGYSLELEWLESTGEWKINTCITAVYTAGSYENTYWSNGFVEMIGTATIRTIDTATGSVFRGSSAETFGFPITLADTPLKLTPSCLYGNGNTVWAGVVSNISTTSADVMYFSSVTGATYYPVLEIKGYY